MNPESHPSPASSEPIPSVEASYGNFIEAPRVERAPIDSPESFGPLEQRSEAPSSEYIQSVATTPAPVAPAVATPVVAQDDATIADPSNPAEAKDSDVIEREWVMKAKQILSETKEDPHARGEQVKALQADYLKKRYNRAIGDGDGK